MPGLQVLVGELTCSLQVPPDERGRWDTLVGSGCRTGEELCRAHSLFLAKVEQARCCTLDGGARVEIQEPGFQPPLTALASLR